MAKTDTVPGDMVASMPGGVSAVSGDRIEDSYVDAAGEGPRSEAEPRQTSFEMYSAQQDPLYLRDVSEGEGIAAFALLECGQSVGRSSSGSSGEGVGEGAGGGGGDGSGGGAGSDAGRIDSGSWMNLLGSGGEPTGLPLSAFPRSGSGSSTSSSGAGAGGSGRGAVLSAMDNDPGPMPDHAPFGFGRYSGSGATQTPRPRASRSRTSWERRLFASSLENPHGSGTRERGGGSGGGGGIGPGRVSGASVWMPVHSLPSMGGAGPLGMVGSGRRSSQGPPPTFRQCSFDPHEPVFGLPLQSDTWGGQYHTVPVGPPPTVGVAPAMPPADRSFSSLNGGSMSFTGGSRPAAGHGGFHPRMVPYAAAGGFVEATSRVRDGGPGGGIEVSAPTTYPPHARNVAPVRIAATVQGAEAAPRNRLSGGSTVTRLGEHNDNRNDDVKEDASDHAPKPSFDHLKSLIPGFEALTGGGGGGRQAANSNGGMGGDAGNGRSSFSEGIGNKRAVTPPEGKMDSPSGGGSGGLLKRPFSAVDSSSCHNGKPVAVDGLTIGQEHIMTPRQVCWFGFAPT